MRPRTLARLIWLPIVVVLSMIAGLLLWSDFTLVRILAAAAVFISTWLIVQLLIKNNN
jgi:hypothetical protein